MSSFHRSVHISLWQGALHPPEVSTWEKQLQKRAREAKEKGAEILLTPELMVPGYDFFGKNGFDLEPSKIESAIQACALDCDIALCVGYAEAIGEEKVPGKTHWNTAILVDRQGKVVMRYRKHHCWGNEGNLGLQESCDSLQVAHLSLRDGTLRISILICYDVEFPEMVRILALQKAELILVPTALPYTEPNVSIRIIPATAMQNRLFIAYCNLPCLPRVNGDYFCGHSCVAGPDGNHWAGPMGWRDEALLHSFITWNEDLAYLARETPYLCDRKPEFYASQGFCQPSVDQKPASYEDGAMLPRQISKKNTVCRAS